MSDPETQAVKARYARRDAAADASRYSLYANAAAGGVRRKYFISMEDAAHSWSLFVYDTRKGLWHREDSTHASEFARVGDELYFLENGTLRTVYGTAGTKDGPVGWMAETGIMTYGLVGKKYVSRINLRMQLPKGSSFCAATLNPRAFKRRPSEAAVMPLPRPETTPPVTKMYFVISFTLPKDEYTQKNLGRGGEPPFPGRRLSLRESGRPRRVRQRGNVQKRR